MRYTLKTNKTMKGNYIGFLDENNEPDGFGEIIFDNKIKYMGEFKNGYIEGQGKYTIVNDDYYYEGQFKKDKFHGYGKFVNINEEISEGW